jgi:hypothetical protein
MSVMTSGSGEQATSRDESALARPGSSELFDGRPDLAPETTSHLAYQAALLNLAAGRAELASDLRRREGLGLSP